MKNIEFEQLVLFHKKIVARTGGSSGVRDAGLLKSALGRVEKEAADKLDKGIFEALDIGIG